MLKFKDLMERLNVAKAKMGDVIKDFQDSDAPQFKGKSDEKRRQMAIAAKLSTEEVEELDELSVNTVRGYYNKAGEQGKKISDKMKMGGGDWSKDGSDTKTLKKRAAGRTMALKRRSGEVKMSEEVEELDEISQMMARAARDKAGEELAGHRKAIEKEWDKQGRSSKPNYGKVSDIQQQMRRRERLSDKVTRKLAKEESEQTDEALKGNQHKIDANKNGKVDGHDFKILRNAKKARYQ